jgi:hypothetical protein
MSQLLDFLEKPQRPPFKAGIARNFAGRTVQDCDHCPTARSRGVWSYSPLGGPASRVGNDVAQGTIGRLPVVRRTPSRATRHSPMRQFVTPGVTMMVPVLLLGPVLAQSNQSEANSRGLAFFAPGHLGLASPAATRWRGSSSVATPCSPPAPTASVGLGPRHWSDRTCGAGLGESTRERRARRWPSRGCGPDSPGADRVSSHCWSRPRSRPSSHWGSGPCPSSEWV